MKKKIVSLILCLALCLSIVTVLVGCKGGNKTDALVIMTEELDGLFNPFFSTTAADGGVVGMTQIGMLTTALDENGDVTVAFGEDEAVISLAFDSKYDATAGNNPDKKGQTTYTFVIKNGIKYSDGQPLTIEDVLFNMYVYLDPVYTGSSTMYSTDIVGLKDYRTQIKGASDSSDDAISKDATARATARINALINLFKQNDTGSNKYDDSYEVPYADMVAAINNWTATDGYKKAITTPDKYSEVTNAQLLKDYEQTLKYFKEELGTDYVAAQEAFDLEKAPYNDPEFKALFEDEIFRFMYYEGFVNVVYEDHPDGGGKKDKNNFKEVTKLYNEAVCTKKEDAIDYVYNSKISTDLHIILSYWATATKLQTEYSALATEVILREKMKGDGSLLIPNIEGIKSLGHTTDVTTVNVAGKDYKVAHDHNEDGTPKNADEYDVLQITIDGVDPKAVWNFTFAVAPQHYYAAGREVDIKNNKFGVEFGSFSFMTNEIQAPLHNKIPVGAGPYKATNESNSDAPGMTEFFSNNVVYFKANSYFEESFGEAFHINIPKIRYQVVSSSNALNALESGAIHYATPQLTDNNITKLDSLKDKGLTYTYTDQLGYGYIGINAGKVQDINIRRAIMSAMNTSLAIEYYRANTASTIYWPISKVSWAYPEDNVYPDQKYIDFTFTEAEAKTKIEEYMQLAGVSAGDSELSIKFTVAGSNLTDHPTYAVFQQAATILNSMGWDIEVVADTQALTKLSTGSLAVWAAAWGSTIDPDMYQVYHKNSTATSVLAWGYDDILANPGTYVEENAILNELSTLIDDARETEDRAIRSDLYQQAMSKVIDLAVEMPVYQRSVLYAYNEDVISTESLPEKINPYSSPLDKIWTVKFADGVEIAGEGESTENDGLGIGAIIGIVAGSVVVVAGAVVAAIVVLKKKGGVKGAVAVDTDDANVPETNENVNTEQTDISTENSSDNNEDGQ